MAKAKTPASGGKNPTDTAKPDTTSDTKPGVKASSSTRKSATTTKPAKSEDKKAPAKSATKGVPKVAKAADAKAVETKDAAETKKAESAAKSQGAASEPAQEPKASTPDADRKDAAAADSAKVTDRPAIAPAPTTPGPAPERSGSVFWPLVFGGIVACGLGFAAAELNLLGLRAQAPDLSADVAKLEKAQTEQETRLAALENAGPDGAETADLGGIRENLSAISDTLTAFETRLAELENRPIGTGDGTTGASEDVASELAALQGAIEQQKAEIDQLLSNAMSVEEATAEAARKTAIQAALTEITAAVTSGSAFSEPVAALQASGVTDLPAGLLRAAENGVPTLSALQSDFPDLARASLAAARASGSGEDGGGLSGFLKRQLGARSVAPREGSDPDAVLSRAEDALRNGDVAHALTEMQGLPAEAQAPLADWIAAARSRADAQAAIQELSQRLSAN